jgi:hypothetical protein
MQIRRWRTPCSRATPTPRGRLLALGLLASASPAAATTTTKYAGHPLRIIAYALHPIGVMFDYLLFRPAHWIGSHEPLKTIFGHTDT